MGLIEWIRRRTFEKVDRKGLPRTDRPEVLREAIRRYGEFSQVDKAIEEMSELIKALLDLRRFPELSGARENVAQEMADVIIMLTQLCMLYGNFENVEQMIDWKVDRLEDRLTGRANAKGK